MKEFICDYKGNKIKVKLDLSKISVIMKYIIPEVWIITAVVIELPTI